MRTMTYNDYLSDIVKEQLYSRLLKDSKLREKQKQTEQEIYDVVGIIVNSAMDPDIKKYWEGGCKRIQKIQERINIKYTDFVPDSTGLYPETSDSPLMIPGYYQRGLDYKCSYTGRDNINQVFPALSSIYPGADSLKNIIDLSKVKSEYLETLKNLLYKYGEISYNIDTFLHEYRIGYGYSKKFLKNITTWGALKKKNEEWFEIACELTNVDQTSFTIMAGKTKKDLPETKSNLVESTIDKIRRSINNPNP